MLNKCLYLVLLIAVLVVSVTDGATAAEKVDVNVGVDFYSRYVWRGLDIGSNPSIQPSLTAGWYGFELGAWGAYSVSTEANGNDEIDFWLGYEYVFNNGTAIGAVVTDYYFPNGGEKFFDFNGDDGEDEDGNPIAGAHTIEYGMSITIMESFPLTLSGYVNIHNDRGNNTYFQLDYPFTVGEIGLDVFLGAAGGSARNPDYYSTDHLNVTNVGVTASREIAVTEKFSLPMTGSLIINPHVEIVYFVVGLSF